MTTPKSYSRSKNELLSRLYEIDDIESAASVLMWDQATLMPPGGAAARARQIATLRRLAHERLIDPEMGRLIAAFERHTSAQPYESDDAALVRVTRRLYDRSVGVPADFLSEFTEHASTCFSKWSDARPANDFASVQPLLEQTLELSRRYADFFPDADHPADPLIDRSDFGMSVASIRPIFASLRVFLSSLSKRIAENMQVESGLQDIHFDPAVQRQVSIDIVKRFGYDFSRGRLDDTHHPFMVKFSLGDARITSRFSARNLSGVFSTMHEAGHAMYEQGINRSFERTPLADGTSSAVHESQSRTWENIVGRSHAFWKGYYPTLQSRFSDALGDVPLERFYSQINRVSPSLIRVDADEVTYGLHVIIRFELELDLLEGRLSVAELPDAWNAKYREYLGVTPPDHKDGVLQDVHWYTDFVGGMFQGYLLGNVLASQFFEAALRAGPEIPSEIEQGYFGTLLKWLTDNVYCHGAKYTTLDLVERITGGSIDTEPYQRYLLTKYGDIYAFA